MANQFYLAIARAMKTEMDRDGTAGKYSSDRGVLWAKKEKAANG